MPIILVGVLVISRPDQPLWSGDRRRLGTQGRQKEANEFSIAAPDEGLTISNDGLVGPDETWEERGAARPRFGQAGRFGIGRERVVGAETLVEYMAETQPRLG